MQFSLFYTYKTIMNGRNLREIKLKTRALLWKWFKILLSNLESCVNTFTKVLNNIFSCEQNFLHGYIATLCGELSLFCGESFPPLWENYLPFCGECNSVARGIGCIFVGSYSFARSYSLLCGELFVPSWRVATLGGKYSLL